MVIIWQFEMFYMQIYIAAGRERVFMYIVLVDKKSIRRVYFLFLKSVFVMLYKCF